MKDKNKTKEQLLKELSKLQKQVAKLGKIETKRKQAEEALNETQETFNALINATQETLIMIDKEGTVLLANEVVARRLGTSVQELIDSCLYDHFSPDVARLRREQFDRVSLTGEPVHFQDAREGRFFETYCYPVFDMEGKVSKIAIFGYDITDRKQVEEALESERNLLRTLIDNMPDRIYAKDSEGRFIICNEALARRMGKTNPNEIIGKSDFDLIPRELAQRFRKDEQAIIESGIPMINREEPLVSEGGKITRWNLATKVPLLDKQGNRIGIVGVGREITDLKQAEEEIRERERLFTLTLDDMTTFVALLKIDGEIIFVNNTPLKLIGKSIEQVRGIKFYDVDWWTYSKETQQLIKEDLQRCASGEKIYHEVQIWTLNGFLWIDFSIHPILGENGNILYLIPEGQDITEKKLAQEALNSSEQKYRSIFENAFEGIFQSSLDGRFLSINPALARMHGFSSPEEMIKSITNIDKQLYVDPEDRKRFRQLIKGQGRIENFEAQFYKKDGTKTWMSLNIHTGKDATGKVLYYEGISEDITHRKDAEEALRIEMERFQTLSEEAPFGMVLIDRDGTFKYINSTFRELFGYELTEIPDGKTWLRKAHPDPSYRHHIIGTWLQDLEEFKPGERRSKVFTVTCKDGTERIINFITVQLTTGENLMVCEDITERKRAEEELRKSEEKYRFITDRINDVVWTLDAKLRPTYVSPSIQKILGFTPEERLRQNLLERVTPASAEKVREILKYELERDREKGVDPDRFLTFELEYYHKDGSTVWMEQVVGFIRDGEGNITGVHGVSRNITERKRVEEALQQAEKKYRSIFENVVEGIYQATPEGRYLTVNPPLARIYGYSSPEEFVETITDIGRQVYVNPDDRLRFLRILKEKGEITGFEVQLKRKDGSAFWASVNARLVYDEKGNILYYEGTVEDITDRKQAEETLRESEERYRRLVDNSLLGIGISYEDQVLFANPALLGLFGYDTLEEFSKIPLMNHIAPASRELIAARMEKVTQGKPIPAEFEYDILRKDGLTKTLLANSTHFTLGGKTYTQTTFQDITERKQTEEERRRLVERLNRAEKMEALGTLAGGVAHDLNNVLGVLVGYAELLLEKIPEASPLKKYVENILHSSQRGAAIIEDMLTLARRGVPVSKIVNLNEVISDYFKTPEFEKLKAYHPKVTFMTELDKDLLYIKGSPVHLEKTIMNLVSNASEAITDKGEVTIRTENLYLDKPIKGYDDVQEGDYVVLSVSDNGKGIPSSDLEKIFEPFYTKKTMGRSGTGLGLAVVWGTVKDHKGYIDVQSKVGEGSRFTLYFPVTREEPEKAGKDLSPIVYLGKKESILVVDDVKEQRELAINMLSRLNYKVTAVSSGEEAAAYLRDNQTDLVVLDMIMDPGIDGLETYQRIIEINPKQKAIMVSGFSETERVRKALELGAGAYIRKPYALEKIGLAIRKELDK